MRDLLKNEVLKLRKRTFLLVIFIGTLILSVIVPSFSGLITLLSPEDLYSPETVQETNRELIKLTERYADESVSTELEILYYEKEIEAAQFYIDEKSPNWVFQYTHSDYALLVMTEHLCTLLQNQTYKLEEIEKSMFSSCLEDYGLALYDEKTGTYSPITAEELALVAVTVRQDLEELRERIRLSDPVVFLEAEKEARVIGRDAAVMELNLLGLGFGALDKEQDEEYLQRKAELESQIRTLEATIQAYDPLIADRVPLFSWRHDLVANRLYDAHMYYESALPLSEEEYLKSFYVWSSSFSSYENYLRSCENNRRYYGEVVSEMEYALEKKIPPIATEDSPRNEFLSLSDTLISFVGFFAVFAAGFSVANEFASGTVRLLLIRPKKRWKILLAKYLAVLSLSGILMLVSILFSFLASLFAGNLDTFFSPVLFAGKNGVTEIPFVLYALSSLFASILEAVFPMTLVFFCSAAFRSMLAAVALGYLFTVVAEIFRGLFGIFEFTGAYFLNRITVFSYLDLGEILLPSLESYLSSFTSYGMVPYDLPFAAGFFLYLVSIAGIYLLSARVFSRREIKN